MLEDMDKIIVELDKKVCHFVKPNINISTTKSSHNFNYGMSIYVIAPISLVILFILIKPSFVKKNIVVDGVIVDSKLNISKIIYTTIVLSIIIDICIYKYQ
jgi:hypothetical protein